KGQRKSPAGNVVLPVGLQALVERPTPGRTLQGRGHQRQLKERPRLMANPIATGQWYGAAVPPSTLPSTVNASRFCIALHCMALEAERFGKLLRGGLVKAVARILAPWLMADAKQQ